MNLKKLKHLLIVKKKIKKLKLICIFYLRVFCDLSYLIFLDDGFYLWELFCVKKRI